MLLQYCTMVSKMVSRVFKVLYRSWNFQYRDNTTSNSVFPLLLTVRALTFASYAQIDSVNEGFWQTVCVKILLRDPEGFLQLTSSLGKTLAAFSHAVKPGSVLKNRPRVLKLQSSPLSSSNLSVYLHPVWGMMSIWMHCGVPDVSAKP